MVHLEYSSVLSCPNTESFLDNFWLQVSVFRHQPLLLSPLSVSVSPPLLLSFSFGVSPHKHALAWLSSDPHLMPLFNVQPKGRMGAAHPAARVLMWSRGGCLEKTRTAWCFLLHLLLTVAGSIFYSSREWLWEQEQCCRENPDVKRPPRSCKAAGVGSLVLSTHVTAHTHL